MPKDRVVFPLNRRPDKLTKPGTIPNQSSRKPRLGRGRPAKGYDEVNHCWIRDTVNHCNKT